MEENIRLLLVEDEITSVIFLRKMLEKKGYSVKVAYDGDEALKELELGKYDIIITDWMMPKLDGIELIHRVRENISPSPYIIMLTALSSDGAKSHAFASGADDFMAKPVNFDELNEKIILAFNKLNNKKEKYKPIDFKLIKQKEVPDFVGVAIATSTGGPTTIVELVKGLNSKVNAAYFIVQHGPLWMIETFVSRLANETNLKVYLAEDNMKFEKSSIYVCPGDKHLFVNSDYTLTLSDGQKENFVRPSADPLFRSVANTFNERAIGIVLTGLGRDGANGCSVIKQANGKVLVQKPETAIAPSMPRTVIEEGNADFVLEVKEIANKIDELVKSMV